ncbi:MAG: TlpA family protein disulfide reductase [Candidatus Omnitrophica bacterium]|nr:TlpA family protein disulfide reductase [Candidatus Omnitrophota bacterium]
MAKKILFTFLAITLTLFTFTDISFSAGATVGSKAPEFSLNDLNEKPVSLKEFGNNKAVLLVFWATWCPYCVQEIPELKRINSEYKDKGLEIIAVDIRENPALVSDFAKKQGIDYTIVIDADGSVSKDYNVVGIPTNVLIDKNGIIQYNANPMPSKKLIDKLIKEIDVK